MKTSRGRSHSSIDVEEILRTQQQQDTNDMNASESRRKSRRVSLGMRPKFSNWSKVKGAFKRDKSNSRIDSRDDELEYSGDEATGGDKMVSQFSPSHENLAAQTLSSSEEDFEFYTDGYSVKKGSGTFAKIAT